MKAHTSSSRGRYFSTKEVSCLFGVNDSTVKRWADSGKLKCFKTLGGHRRYRADRIQEFIDTYEYDVEATPAEFNDDTGNNGEEMMDFHLLKNDHRSLREVYFADAMKADIESLTKLLLHCSLEGEISLKFIFDEIVLQAIDKVRTLFGKQKLDRGQEERAINAILESFARFQESLRTSTEEQD